MPRCEVRRADRFEHLRSPHTPGRRSLQALPDRRHGMAGDHVYLMAAIFFLLSHRFYQRYDDDDDDDDDDDHNFYLFVDLEKTFDRVDWSKLMGILKKIGVDWKERRQFSNPYMKQRVKVRNRGGMIVGERRIKCIRFADDMALLAKEEMILRDMLLELNDSCEHVALYGADTWTLRRSKEKQREEFEMWIWKRMERVKWTDRIRNESVLERVGVERMMLKLIKKRKRNWLGHWLRGNCLLKDALEGMCYLNLSNSAFSCSRGCPKQRGWPCSRWIRTDRAGLRSRPPGSSAAAANELIREQMQFARVDTRDYSPGATARRPLSDCATIYTAHYPEEEPDPIQKHNYTRAATSRHAAPRRAVLKTSGSPNLFRPL
ncbi:hypothetical protein ANN_15893 [Periplaneta americana]|uniref:Reverse transcriptase domain-containing protein n=1 Tax=Periplaneta americana TaxID=6978 RepID=A0ABQ8SHW7_PERAM|nr:hypothetical protein ANN_15893 [Periplaneta americana]